MGGAFTAGGLITGLDTNSLISQLIALERLPILRVRQRITALEASRDTVRDLRTQLQTLRNRVQDFKLTSLFAQFETTTSDESILTSLISGENPTSGAFVIDVQQLASATVALSNGSLGATINSAASLASSGINTTVTAGTFSVNGISFNVDPAVQSLDTILAAINASGAGVTATFDAVADKVTFANTAPGDTSIINFGADADTSNFLAAINVEGATQFTGGGGSTEVISSRNLGAVNQGSVLNTVAFAGGAISAGTFFVNGVLITVDPTTDSLSSVIDRINQSDAGVTASLDTVTDTIRVVSDTLGSRTISFTSGTSNFLAVTNLTAAAQTAGSDTQFTVNGGAVQIRNQNEVSDAIGGVTLNFLSVGSTTITVSSDADPAVDKIREFVDAFNATVAQLTEDTGRDGALRGDGTIRNILNSLVSNIFQRFTGLPGDFESLLDIGISTGDTFDATKSFELVLDEDKLREAISADSSGVEALFITDADTGIADILFTFLDDISGIAGSLNDRSKSNGSIDKQIRSLNDKIEQIERRVAQRELRLRAQFSRLEQLSSGFQIQSSALAGLAGGFSIFG